jgi:hypothetical protein
VQVHTRIEDSKVQGVHIFIGKSVLRLIMRYIRFNSSMRIQALIFFWIIEPRAYMIDVNNDDNINLI